MSKVFVGFLLDRTGSMAKIKGDTIGGFNEYKRTLGDNSDGLEVEAYMSLYQFNSESFDTLAAECSLGEVPDLTEDNFRPSGWTNLIDSLHRTIKEIEVSQLALVPDMKIVISILTDGQENSSQHVTKDQLAELIAEKQGLGWAFNFMGAGFDVYKESVSKMVGMSNSMSYASGDSIATSAAFSSTASNSRRFASGIAVDMTYNKDQRTRSGDTFSVKDNEERN